MTELEDTLREHIEQLDFMTSNTLNEWVRANIDTDNRFERNVIAHAVLSVYSLAMPSSLCYLMFLLF